MTREPTEMEMRVAQAIQDERYGDSVAGLSPSKHSLDLARAAIRAMREPTPKMCGDGRAMIKAATSPEAA